MQYRWRGATSQGDRAESIPLNILARMPRAGQLPRAEPSVQFDRTTYAFLVGTLIDQATLEQAEAEAVRCGVAVHEILLAAGHVSQSDYTAALALQLGVPAVDWSCEFHTAEGDSGGVARSRILARIGRRTCRVMSATDLTPPALWAEIMGLRRQGIDVASAPRSMIEAVLEARERGLHVDRAVNGLLRARPESSAGARAPIWQALAGVVGAGIVVGGLAVLPEATLALVTALIAIPFLCVTLLRLLALSALLGRPMPRKNAARKQHQVTDRLLPVYTVLVPLLREANVLPGLVASLRAIDYPLAKHEIFLIIEASDSETQIALLGMHLPGNFRIVIVPDGGPQTKPKALNYALQFARGTLVVVYDAEDRPQPSQLRLAVQAFRQSPPKTGCLQAQLNIYNPSQSWFTRGLMAHIAEEKLHAAHQMGGRHERRRLDISLRFVFTCSCRLVAQCVGSPGLYPRNG